MNREQRDQVIMVRVDEATLRQLDAWVKTEAVKSRSRPPRSSSARASRSGLRAREAGGRAGRRRSRARTAPERVKEVFGEKASRELICAAQRVALSRRWRRPRCQSRRWRRLFSGPRGNQPRHLRSSLVAGRGHPLGPHPRRSRLGGGARRAASAGGAPPTTASFVAVIERCWRGSVSRTSRCCPTPPPKMPCSQRRKRGRVSRLLGGRQRRDFRGDGSTPLGRTEIPASSSACSIAIRWW